MTVLDKLTYAGNLASLDGLPDDRVRFVQRRHRRRRARRRADSLDADTDAVVHYAAESHNDNSLTTPARSSTRTSSAPTRCSRRHAGTASASTTSRPTRSTATSNSTTRRASPSRPPYNPSSPYSSTKAGSGPARARVGALLRRARDHLATARTTTGPTSTSRSSSPARSPTCCAAIDPSSTAPGENVRDWIHADDHSSAVLAILDGGRDRRDLPHRRRRRANEQRGRRRHPRGVRPAARRLRPRQRPPRARPALRDRLDQAARRARLARRATATSSRACAATIDWYRDNEAWWAPQKQATEAKYSESGR